MLDLYVYISYHYFKTQLKTNLYTGRNGASDAGACPRHVHPGRHCRLFIALHLHERPGLLEPRPGNYDRDHQPWTQGGRQEGTGQDGLKLRHEE